MHVSVYTHRDHVYEHEHEIQSNREQKWHIKDLSLQDQTADKMNLFAFRLSIKKTLYVAFVSTVKHFLTDTV